jgi:hypothetical protein
MQVRRFVIYEAATGTEVGKGTVDGTEAVSLALEGGGAGLLHVEGLRRARVLLDEETGGALRFRMLDNEFRVREGEDLGLWHLVQDDAPDGPWSVARWLRGVSEWETFGPGEVGPVVRKELRRAFPWLVVEGPQGSSAGSEREPEAAA